jgi:hypothetical protein
MEKFDGLDLSKDEVDGLLEAISWDPSRGKDDLPVDTRKILKVESHVVVSANWLMSASSGLKGAQSVFILLGPSSGVAEGEANKAYIVFSQEKVKTPRFVKSSGAIYLWMPERMLPIVQSQLGDKSVYCWIGHFENGHIYGDIHSSSR